jgi:hypothetical protein
MKVTNAPVTTVLARAAILFAALSALCLLLAGCGSAGPAVSPASPATASATTAAVTKVSAGGVFGRVLSNPVVTVTGGQLYVAWQLNRGDAPVPRYELARADPATGAIKAERRLPPGSAGTPLAAGGWLWITTTASASERLLRMNPATLAVTGNTGLSGRGYTAGGNDLAAAGGELWAASGGRLLRVSPRTGRVTAMVPLASAATSNADNSDVAASAAGTVLVVGEAREGLGAVQRRDPVTGALLASHPMLGVTAPLVGAVTGSGVWVAEPTGMMGYVERFSTATMAPDPATQVEGTNGINVRAGQGVVWVSRPGGPAGTYCADPATGRALARVRLPDPAQDYVIAVSSRSVYYLAPGGAGFHLRQLRVPAGCRVG